MHERSCFGKLFRSERIKLCIVIFPKHLFNMPPLKFDVPKSNYQCLSWPSHSLTGDTFIFYQDAGFEKEIESF